MEPVVKELACSACGKPSKVRVVPTSSSHTFHCPHCKAIQTAQG